MKLKVIELEKTCEACPAQWEGKLEDGRTLYIRYRWGWLSVRVSKKPTKDICEAIGGEEILGVQHGDEYDGTMSLETLEALTKGVINYEKVKEEENEK